MCLTGIVNLESLDHPGSAKLLLDALIFLLVLLLLLLTLVALDQLKVVLETPGEDLRPTCLSRFYILPRKLPTSQKLNILNKT